MDSVRMDMWLWAARFFKTRALAKKACELGRVESHGHTAKPAREVRVGDQLKITNDSGEFTVEVLAISDVRGPATVAQNMYRESEESRALRQKAAEERKALAQWQPAPQGRPTKRDRRRIIQFRGGR
jgi:ribosome-associated heat shock protein Hsp15